MLRKCAAALFLISGVTNAASFDCTKATSKAEKLICSTPVLSQADDELYIDYLQTKVITGNSDDFKALVKQNWKLREKNCDTEECLLNWYKKTSNLYKQIAVIGKKENQTSENPKVDEYGLPIPKNEAAYSNYIKIMKSGIAEKSNVLKKSQVTGTYTGAEIYSDYESNLLSASKLYTGKKIRITGYINSVGTDYSNRYAVVNVSGDPENVWDPLSVVSLYADKNDDYVLALRKGGNADMVCIGAGAGDMDEPLFAGCISYDEFTNRETRIQNAGIYSLYMSNENIMTKWCAKGTGECRDNFRNGIGKNDSNISENFKEFVLKYNKQLTAKYGRAG
ncbi:hypothetical protein J8V57_12615 [Xenorhabdus sp. PB61.4]|uniref:lysozyme inhibitor LprI family protein n=1 Tax=Xenorhabdus sp. PB61.4 TaxID=2788940 RepID=UPI001E4A3F22|nr:hypothetical protein [Xenorhabdus sp. PB61.4]MCC8367107.1 hypothetical protein [Xenorhabdus sp. PB61.4]